MKNIDNMNIDEILEFLAKTSMDCDENSIIKKQEEGVKKAKWYAPKDFGKSKIEKKDECPDKKYIMNVGGTISLVPLENGSLNFAKAEIQTLPVDIIVDGRVYRIESNNNITFVPEQDYLGDAYEVTGDSLLEIVETIREDNNILH